MQPHCLLKRPTQIGSEPMGILLSQTTHEIKAHHPPPEAWIGRYLGTIRPEGGSSMRRTETVVFGLRTLLVAALVWLLVAGLLTLRLLPGLPEATSWEGRRVG